MKCGYCEIDFKQSRPNQLYCSKECCDKKHLSRHRYGGNHFNVLKRDNFTCQTCGAKDDLVVHHKDENVENNKMDNLITWCRACHAIHHRSSFNNNHYKHITKEQVERAIELTSTLEEAAKFLGVTRATLRRKRNEFGLPQLSNARKGEENKSYRRLTKTEIELAFQVGGTWKKAAEILGVHDSFLRKKRNELGMEMDTKKTNTLSRK